MALDLCCGAGRHLVTLRQVTRRLAGVDYSPALLALARTRVDPSVGLVRADMRALPFFAAFDVAFSFFTSFGYFMEDRDNFQSARCMARALKPGGRFFLDYLNPKMVARSLQAETERASQGYVIHEQRWIDAEAQRVNKRVTVTQDNRPLGVFMESVRLYAHGEMTDMLVRAGLRVEQSFGDYDGAAYASDSPRMLLVGVKDAP
jgi:SAM-dependent methyltransferase